MLVLVVIRSIHLLGNELIGCLEWLEYIHVGLVLCSGVQ